MVYGTLMKAKEFAETGEIDRWLQLFLRNDGKNIALAEGLLLEERFYLGPRTISIRLLDGIKSGTPEYLTDADSVAYFFFVVEHMKEVFEHWDVPPLIVEYVDGGFRVNDGRHRLEMYRQLQVEEVWAVLWTTGEENYRELLEVLV